MLKNEEKTKVLSVFFAPALNNKTSCPLGTQPLSYKTGIESEASIIHGEMVSDQLHDLDTQKSVGLDGIHPGVLRELVEVLTEPLHTKYLQSWLTGEVPVDCWSARWMPTSKKCCKEDLGNHRPFSLNSCQERSWNSSS